MQKLTACVESCQDLALINRGFKYTVVVIDPDNETDVLDLIDFREKETAIAYAEGFNNREYWNHANGRY